MTKYVFSMVGAILCLAMIAFGCVDMFHGQQERAILDFVIVILARQPWGKE